MCPDKHMRCRVAACAKPKTWCGLRRPTATLGPKKWCALPSSDLAEEYGRQKQRSLAGSEQGEAAMQPLTMIVIDDEADQVDLTVMLLESRGHQAIGTTSRSRPQATPWRLPRRTRVAPATPWPGAEASCEERSTWCVSGGRNDRWLELELGAAPSQSFVE